MEVFRTRSGEVTFRAGQGVGFSFKIPCGQCIGCRLERSRQWAMRCLYESELHQDNCFITLTYSDLHLPAGGGLCKRHFQLFVKRLRKRFTGQVIRYFHCGEYGDELQRPHYHAIIFGLDFSDKILFSERGGNKVYTSEILASLWPFGFSSVGDVTFESAAYVARYCLKKRTGSTSAAYYERINPETGEIFNLQPEYVSMSLKPGIARNWFDKFSSDVFPSDFLIVNGKRVRPPRYFAKQYSVINPEGMERVRLARVRQASKFASDQTLDRLHDREQVQAAQLSQFKRHKEI